MVRLFCDRCSQEITGEKYESYIKAGGRPDTTYCNDCETKMNRFTTWREERREQLMRDLEEKWAAEERAMRKKIFGVKDERPRDARPGADR